MENELRYAAGGPGKVQDQQQADLDESGAHPETECEPAVAEREGDSAGCELSTQIQDLDQA